MSNQTPVEVDPRLAAALNLLGASIGQMVNGEIMKITDRNLQGFFATMLTSNPKNPLTNQQLLFAVSDLGICMKAVLELLITKGVFTNEEWLMQRVHETQARAHYLSNNVPSLITPP